MPKVTIAIPTYNRPEFLAQTIQSILGQTFQDFQVIVFDNHSDYDLPKFLEGFRDSRISCVTEGKNMGVFENFKKIFLYEYKTPYAVVFHDDDLMHPELLERELNIMEADKSVALVGTDLNFVHNFAEINRFGKVGPKENFKILSVQGAVRELFSGFNLSYGSVMYRTDILENIEPFEKEFSKWADRPFVLTLAKKGKMALIYDKLVNYRIHPEQDSQSLVIGDLEYIFKLFDFYKHSLSWPLSLSDNKLFETWSTNNAILSASSFAKSFREYAGVLKIFRKKGFFSFKCINFRGLWYLFKAVKKLGILKFYD